MVPFVLLDVMSKTHWEASLLRKSAVFLHLLYTLVEKYCFSNKFCLILMAYSNGVYKNYVRQNGR